MTNTALPISAADIDAAARVIAPYAVRTPLLPSPALDALTGGRIFVKPEVLQRTGSFKFRGAFNKLSSIPQDERGLPDSRGVGLGRPALVSWRQFCGDGGNTGTGR